MSEEGWLPVSPSLKLSRGVELVAGLIPFAAFGLRVFGSCFIGVPAGHDLGHAAGGSRGPGIRAASPFKLTTPDRDRTCDLSFRKAPLYPTELRGRGACGHLATSIHAPIRRSQARKRGSKEPAGVYAAFVAGCPCWAL